MEYKRTLEPLTFQSLLPGTIFTIEGDNTYYVKVVEFHSCDKYGDWETYVAIDEKGVLKGDWEFCMPKVKVAHLLKDVCEENY